MATSNATFAATAKKLVTTLPAFADIAADFRIEPQGSWVAYRADQDQDEKVELFTVNLTGGTSNKLNGPLSAGANVSAWQLAADGSRAIYWANALGNETREVFSAATLGGGGAKLNSPLVSPGSIGGGWANDRAVFVASERENLLGEPFFDLFSAPAAGGPVALLNGPLVNGGDVKSVVTRSNTDRVLYLADQEALSY